MITTLIIILIIIILILVIFIFCLLYAISWVLVGIAEEVNSFLHRNGYTK